MLDFAYHADWVGRSISSSVLSGSNPTEVDPSNPITLFIIQLVIILVFTQCLGWLFGFLRQPKVIAEVIGGVILGPTVMGRIPGFSATLFNPSSLPYLSVVSNIGLILFLFLVGLEVDVGVIKKEGRKAGLISAGGMILPFGFGAAIAVGLYKDFVDQEKVSFGHFLLFVGVAMSITAFPVLCRILVSTKLLDTTVGVVVLAAGVGNDVVGWVLLALTLALVNASSGVTAVYVLLCAVAWSILLLWPIRKGFVYLARRTGSIDHGPTPFMMMVTLLIVFTSAFITDIIGVHPIFGGFIAGLIIPHEGGFAIALTEKLEELVTMLFLPIYFVQSGLATNLGLLDTGVIWGWVILICVVAFAGKFIGCAAAAKLQGFTSRESGAIGVLMSCKGLVELIVLNVGLSAGILSQTTFSMFVFEAILLTFITTPLTLWIYPAKHRTRPGQDIEQSSAHVISGGSGGREMTTKFLVVLQKIEHLAPVMLLTQMLEPAQSKREIVLRSQIDFSEKSTDSTPHQPSAPLPVIEERATPSIQIDALKIIELTGRTYSVMQSAEKDQLLLSDDALNLFKQFGRLRSIDIASHISVVGEDSFPSAVTEHAVDLGSELVLLPWMIPAGVSISSSEISPTTPFDGVFGTESGSPMYTHFLRNVFAECSRDVGLFIDRGFGPSFSPGSGQHIFLPFFGGPDDRLALRMVVQLCHHNNVTASIVRIEQGAPEVLKESESMQAHENALHSNQLTVRVNNTSSAQHDLRSETADSIAWAFYSATTTHPPALQEALSRCQFWSTTTSTPLSYSTGQAESTLVSLSGSRLWRPLLVVTGRGRRSAAVNHNQELVKILADKSLNPTVGAELRKTVGDAATALMLSGGQAANASFLVLETGKGR